MPMSSGERTQRKARKLNRQKVLELAEQGMSTTDIAQHQGVDRSTVWRFLELANPERQALEHFKQHRGDILARLCGKSLEVQEKILDSLDDGVISALNPHQKSGLLAVLNSQSGTLFDKERLERGQSTANHSILTKVLNGALKDLYSPSTPQPVVSGRNETGELVTDTPKQIGTPQNQDGVQDGAS